MASAADALGYDEQRQPTRLQQLAIAAALAILDGRWRHHAESKQVGLAVAAYGVGKQQVSEFLDKLRALHSGSTTWKPYQDCINALNTRLDVEGISLRCLACGMGRCHMQATTGLVTVRVMKKVAFVARMSTT